MFTLKKVLQNFWQSFLISLNFFLFVLADTLGFFGVVWLTSRLGCWINTAASKNNNIIQLPLFGNLPGDKLVLIVYFVGGVLIFWTYLEVLFYGLRRFVKDIKKSLADE